MSIDELIMYEGEEKGTFKPETPTHLLTAYIPVGVVEYCAKYRRDKLFWIHYTLRSVWEGLTGSDSEHQKICEQMIIDMGLDKASFDKVFKNVTDLLGEKYVKEDALFRYSIVPPGMGALNPKDKKK